MPQTFEGTFAITVNSPIGKQEVTLRLTTRDGSLAGDQIIQTGETLPMYDLATEGDQIAWKVDLTSPPKMTLKFEGRLQGDTLSGKVKAGLLPKSDFAGVRSA